MSEQTADKLEITELLYRYAELIDAGDFDGVGRLLARSTFGGPASGSVSGSENIAKLFAMTTRRYPDHGNTPRTRHLVLNPIVELNDDGTAATRSTFCVMQDTETVSIQPIVVGRWIRPHSGDRCGRLAAVHYDLRLRPAQPATPAPDAFTIHRREVPPSDGRDGLSLAFIREGVGGYPLLLLHGYPETKRIWWRNITALAEAGYEVIAPDLRGYGDSDLSAADVYDLAAWSRDLYLLVHDVLGHEHCGVVGGDLGGAIAVDLLHRYPGFTDKLVFFDSVPPFVFDDFAAAGIDVSAIRAIGDGPTADYRYLQGVTPDELAAELDTPAKRRRYVGGMYGHRLWASPGTFTAADVDFMTEPFSTEERMRAGWTAYQLMHGRHVSEPPILDRKVDVPTLILYGIDDQVIGPDFLHTCEVAFTNRAGPVVLPGAGHFLQWERADLFNPLVIAYFGDVRVRHGR